MKAMTRFAGFAGILCIVALAAIPRAQAPALTQARLDALGPQVGQRVPDFTLPDAQGRSHTLASILGPNGAMLVFFRSADW
jgi:cytochrome oxidase Cu insertion factor (SCO1/SenC/PrrC family)